MNYWLLAFALTFHSANINNSSNEIRWSQERKLNFSDFQGSDGSSSVWCANTSTSIYYRYDIANGKLQNISAYSVFVPKESWMKKNIPAVLEHEQLHFDIAEFYSRKFCADAAALECCKHAQSSLKRLFNEENKECDRMQEQYDQETAHGANREAQQQWTLKLEELLKESSNYTAEN